MSISLVTLWAFLAFFAGLLIGVMLPVVLRTWFEEEQR